FLPKMLRLLLQDLIKCCRVGRFQRWLENSNSAIVNCDELYMGTSMMRSWHNTSVCFHLIFFFIYGSNVLLSMPYEFNCPLRWAIPFMEDMAFFWQNIPTYLLDNAKYKL